MNNPALEPNKDTYCNFATQNIMQSIQSTGLEGSLITGLANDMQSKLAASDRYQKVDFEAAKENAANGGLSIYSTVASRHGHVSTFSVGDNIRKGEVANIGSNNGFQSLYRKVGTPGVYSIENKNVQFFNLKIK